MTSRPLRFLTLLLGSWICVRAALLSPAWWSEAAENAPTAPMQSRPSGAPPSAQRSAQRNAQASAQPAGILREFSPPVENSESTLRLIRDVSYKTNCARVGADEVLVRGSAVAGRALPSDRAVATALLPGPLAPPLAAAPLPPRPAAGRWSASAWLLVRGDGGGRAGLTPGGTLGGSQAGARLGYRLGRAVSLSARVYAPLRRPAGAELAAGVAWRPAAPVPVEILAERRQAVGARGRSAFAIAAYGGGSLALAGRLRLDLYGQAGIVGLRSRDAFADASARISAAAGPVEIGAGAWGGAQPGAARLDAGPTLSWRLPVARANLRIEADWRFRVAGEASPGSGPALILAADF